MKYPVVNMNNVKVEDIDLKDYIFSIEPNDHCVYMAIKNTLANKRQGTSSSLTRSEVSGSTKKPWRQKGTGRARAGTRKSPLWKGGGVIFGPTPRDYSYSIPKKIKQKAYSSVFSELIRDEKIIVVDKIEISEVSTKKLVDIFKKLTSSKKVMFVTDKGSLENYKKIRLSSRNISWVKTVNVDAIDIKDLFYSDVVLIEKNAINKINSRYDNE